MSSIHPETVVTVAVLGGLITLVARHFLAWRTDPARSHLPWIAIGLGGIAFCVIRVLHLSTLDPARALFLVRCQYAVAVFLPGAAAATMETLAERPHSRSTYVLLAATVPVAVLLLASPWLIGGPPVLRHDLFGHPYYGGRASTGLLTLVPLIVWISVVVVRRARALPANLQHTRPSLRWAVAFFVAVGVHDTVMGAGVIRSLHLFELGYLVFAYVASSFEARRTLALRAELEQLVAGKRVMLMAKQVELDARGHELDGKQRSLEEATLELARSEARLAHFAEHTREGLALCDGTRVVMRNPALRGLLGEAEPADALAMFAPREREQAAALLRGSRTGPLELVALTAEGHELTLSVTVADTVPGSRGDRVMFLRDISEERSLQRRLQRADRLAAIGTLAAGTAHEINNPLTYVVGNAELLRDELDRLGALLPAGTTAAAAGLLAELSSGATRIRRVVTQLMNLARDRASDRAAVDVRTVCEQALAIAGNQLRHRARVVRELGSVPPVHASEAQLGQVVLNLLVNAAQAIPEGDASAHEVAIRTGSEGARVVIEVRDTGVGMTPEVRDRIFDPFFTTKDVGQGTGLGLAISLGIVHDLGGSIDVSTAPGRGTTFRIELPALSGEVTAAAAPAPARALTTGRRVLLVDDEELVARTLARLGGDHRIEVVASGAAALDRLSRDRFDVVLCDLMMPEMSGVEVYRRLAARDPEQATRMVFVTGGVSSAEAQAFLAEPGRRWITKPVSRAELRQAVDEVPAWPAAQGAGGIAST